MGEQAIVMVALGDADQKPLLYACAKCGSVYSPRIYAANDEVSHKTAREAAEHCYNCRTHNVCSDCGTECDKLYTKCAPCRHKSKLERTAEVPLDGIEECFGFSDGEFYRSLAEAADAGEDWVHPATFRPFKIDVESLVDATLDDHHDEATPDDLKGLDALAAAVRMFNEAQTGGSFDCDNAKRASLLKFREPINA
jgi:hypothetical protein